MLGRTEASVTLFVSSRFISCCLAQIVPDGIERDALAHTAAATSCFDDLHNGVSVTTAEACK